jgi:hypothetical protein
MFELDHIFSELNRHRVRYLLAGGLAVNLYGIERATADVDLVVDLEPKNLERFLRVLSDLGFRPRIPAEMLDFLSEEKRRKWIKEKHMKVFSFAHSEKPYLVLDIFTQIPFDFARVYKSRKKIRAGNIVIPVVPLKDLIRMKEASGRPQDKADVSHLRKIAEEWNEEK